MKIIAYKNNKPYDLKERTAQFGEQVIVFIRNLKKDKINIPLVDQLIRSVTSIGANYMEATESESKKDFVYKLSISKKEAKESQHWFRMISAYSQEATDQCKIFQQEADELVRIFGRIISNNK